MFIPACMFLLLEKNSHLCVYSHLYYYSVLQSTLDQLRSNQTSLLDSSCFGGAEGVLTSNCGCKSCKQVFGHMGGQTDIEVEIVIQQSCCFDINWFDFSLEIVNITIRGFENTNFIERPWRFPKEEFSCFWIQAGIAAVFVGKCRHFRATAF